MCVKIISRSLIVFYAAFLFALSGVCAQARARDSVAFRITFASDSTAIDLDYGENRSEIEAFGAKWNELTSDSAVVVSAIKLTGNASRDGWYSRNYRLARKRVKSTADFLAGHFAVSRDLFARDIDTWLKDRKKRSSKPVLVKVVPNVMDRACRIVIEYTFSPKAEPVMKDDSAFAPAAIPVVEAPAAIVAVPAARPSSAASENLVRDAWRLKTNLLYDIATVANLSVEYGFCRHWAVELLATFSPWDINYNFKIRTLLFQPEVRYYLKEGYKGHYFGLEGHFGWYNVAFPGNPTRFQDRDGNTPLWGGGLLYGYLLPFGKHWGMDFNIGIGYARLDYDCFYNVQNGAKYTSGTRDWIGPTKLGVTIYYQF